MGNIVTGLLEKCGITSFTAGELTRPCGIPPAEYLQNIIPAISLVQAIRSRLSRPVIIHSSYRSPAYNRSIGGKAHSLHLVFNALDFSPAGYNQYEIETLYHQICQGQYKIPVLWRAQAIILEPSMLGLGLYSSFIHLDARVLLGLPGPARWSNL